MSPSIHLITGIPASGKSTVGAALARRFERGVHVDGDAVRDMVVRGRADMSPHAGPEAVAQLRHRYRLSVNLAESFFDHGFHVVLQDNVLGRFLAEVVERIARRPLHVVVLAPHADVVAARESERGKSAYDAPWTPHAMDAGLRARTPRLGLWLDTSDLDVERTVDTILAQSRESAV